LVKLNNCKATEQRLLRVRSLADVRRRIWLRSVERFPALIIPFGRVRSCVLGRCGRFHQDLDAEGRDAESQLRAVFLERRLPTQAPVDGDGIPRVDLFGHPLSAGAVDKHRDIQVEGLLALTLGDDQRDFGLGL
jgi:hypothetical protein